MLTIYKNVWFTELGKNCPITVQRRHKSHPGKTIVHPPY
jgi:hypothetical protein